MSRTRLLFSLVVGSLLLGSFYCGQSTAIAQRTPVFSSSYTPLTKCGSGMTKKEEREAEQNGSDIPSKCKGLDGYSVNISYSACSSVFNLLRGDENIPLATQALSWPQKTVE